MSTAQFGGWLKHAREARGLSIEAIARLTKIPARHVEALERGDALPLPAFYQRAEVRAVARVVGVDEQLALERLEAELPHVAPPRRAPAPEPEPSAPSGPRTVRLDSVLAIVATSMLVAWLNGWGPFERRAANGDLAELPAPAPITAPQPAAAPFPIEVPSPPPETTVAPTVQTVAAPVDAPIAPIEPISVVAPTQLVVQTQPEGARVTVNGIGWGESPITIQNLQPGEQHIRVTMDGFIATERSVVVDEGRPQAVNIDLDPQ